MTKRELKLRLDAEGISDALYNIGENNSRNTGDAVVLEQDEDGARWSVYYRERGAISYLTHHYNESDACKAVYRLLGLGTGGQ